MDERLRLARASGKSWRPNPLTPARPGLRIGPASPISAPALSPDDTEAFRAKVAAAPDRRPREPPTLIAPGKLSPRRLAHRRSASRARLPMHVAEGMADCGRGVLGVIAEAAGPRGACTLLMGQIANKVGCTVETVRLTLREAERRGLVTTMHRRVGPRRNAPNVVTIACARWRDWIANGLKGAAKRVGAELRTQAQEVKAAFRHRKERRAAAAAKRVERQRRIVGPSANCETPKASGPNPEPFFQKDTPSVATQLWEENCPNGSSISGGGRGATATWTEKI